MGRIVLKNLTKSFEDKEIIPSFDLEINDGEFVVFVGPSGCGKSTLLRLIAGLEDLTSGTIEIDGKDATNLSPSARGLAMVFQSYALYPHMTVKQNIAFPLKMAKLSKSEIKEKVDSTAEILKLTEYLGKRPSLLSGGQRQRVAIGRALVREPAAFLFDEPLSNLDAALRVNMRQEITLLHRELATTMIYVTHDQVEAMTMADKIVVLHNGLIEQVGSPLDLYNKPNNKFVAGFIGSPRMNFITGKDAEEYNTHTIGVRPEHLTVAEDGDGKWRGIVGVSEHLGSETYLSVLVEDLGNLVVRSAGDIAARHGDTISLKISGKVYLFDQDDNSL